MLDSNSMIRSGSAAIALALLQGLSNTAIADDDPSGSVESRGAVAKIKVSHPDGMKKVSWYNDSMTFEDSKSYAKDECPKSDEIALGSSQTNPHLHGHLVVIEPCDDQDLETFLVTVYSKTNWTAGKFQGFGNTVEDDDSSFELRVTDVNIDGIPDIVVVEKSNGQIMPTIMLGDGNGNFDELLRADDVTSSLSLVEQQTVTASFKATITPASGNSGDPITIQVTDAAPSSLISVFVDGFGSIGYYADANGQVTIPERIFGNPGDTFTITVWETRSGHSVPLEVKLTYTIKPTKTVPPKRSQNF